MKKWKPKKAQEGIKFTPINIKDYRYDQEGNIVNNKTGETGTLALSEVRVIANNPKNYRSSFDGSLRNFTNTLNVMTGGISNRFSPTQNIRAAYDLFDPSLSTQDKINSTVYGNNGIVSNKFVEEHPILSFGTNLIGDAATPKSLLNTIIKSTKSYQLIKDLYNNVQDLRYIRDFNKRYRYNLIKPKTSIIFNNQRLDDLYNHTAKVHNTFARGVDPYEAIEYGRFPDGINPKEAARYSLTHIPLPTKSNDAGLLEGEAALYTSNSIDLAKRYTNGNGYVGILRRPLKYGQETRRNFLKENDFRFHPIPDNDMSITTDYPSYYKPWTRELHKGELVPKDKSSYKDGLKYRVSKYKLSPENQYQVRANAGSFPYRNTNMADDNFRHYLFIGSEGDQPLELLDMFPVRTDKGISDYDFTSVGLSHKK